MVGSPEEQKIAEETQEKLKENVKKEYIIEVQHRRIKISLQPRMKYFPMQNTNEGLFTVYISRNATVGELHARITRTLVSRQSKFS